MEPAGANGAEVKGEPVAASMVKKEEEDADKLNLGLEFSGEKAQPLFLAEVTQLLQMKEANNPSDDSEMNVVLKKSLRYLERFDTIQNQEAAVDVRKILEKAEPKLHSFEIMQLASLVPKDAEEAKAVIRSLQTTYEDDAKLNDILKTLDNFIR